jgi:hypothetical protein
MELSEKMARGFERHGFYFLFRGLNKVDHSNSTTRIPTFAIAALKWSGAVGYEAHDQYGCHSDFWGAEHVRGDG